jgi:tetratricopeptide (TPR) repeat protein
VLLDNCDGAVVVAERAGEPEGGGSLPLAGLLIRQRRPGPGDVAVTVATPTDYGGLAVHAENLLQHFLSLEAEVGGDQLYPSLAGHVERVAPVVDEFPRPSLLSAFAQLCQMTGWLALDANRHSVARQYLSTAVLAAHQADEPALAASCLAYMSLQETYREHPQRALALARTACDVVSSSGTPRTNTMLATRLARAYARIGNRQESLAAIGRAERAFATADGSGQSEPLWLSYVDQREIAAQKGACYLDLGMPGEAITALTEALRLLDRHTPTHARDRVHYLSRLAKCHLLAGDLDQACATAHETLDSGWMLTSARVVERLSEFHAALAPYAVHRDVRVFRDRFNTFIQR